MLCEMNTVIEIYSQLDSKIGEIEALIEECLNYLNPPMLSIPGVGVKSSAVILAEFGDFSKFQNPSQMPSFSGMEPDYFQSGASESTGKMVKHGSSFLRYALSTQTVINYEPTFAEYYAKKRAEGKPYRVALIHTAKKLLRVIYTLQTQNISYNPDLIR
ncbi:MAG: transposase [Clostridiales bacterium]|nr:transposase [Clostridiales bacterium]